MWLLKNINDCYTYINDIHFQAYFLTQNVQQCCMALMKEKDLLTMQLQVEFELREQHKSAMIYCIFHLLSQVLCTR